MPSPKTFAALAAVTVGATVCWAALDAAHAPAKEPAPPKIAALETPDFAALSPPKTTLEGFVPQLGHSRAVSSIAFDADATVMASASGFDDGMVKVWDLKQKRLLHTLDGEDYVAVSPDGAFVASGNVGGPITVWATDGWSTVKTLEGAGPILFTPDGKHLIGEAPPEQADGEGAIKRWSTGTWEAAGEVLKGHEAALTGMSLSVDSRILATGSYDGAVKVWDLKTGEIARTFTQSDRVPVALAIAPDGESLAVAYGDGAADVAVWDVSASEVSYSLPHEKMVTQVAWAPDGATIATTSIDAKTRLFGASGTLKETLTGAGQVAFTPDGAQIVHGEESLVMRGMDGAIAHTFGRNESLVFQTVFSADGAQLMTTNATDSVDVWDVATGALARTVAIPNGTSEEPLGEVILSPRGTYVARRPFVGNAVDIMRVADGETHTTITAMAPSVRDVVFSPDETEVVLECNGRGERTKLIWWDLEEERQIAGTTISGYVRVDGFVEDGKDVALVSMGTSTGGAKLALKLWNRDTGLLASLDVTGIPPYAGDLDFAPAGALIALGDADASVKLWDREAAEMRGALKGHDGLVNHVVFSPDAQLLATAGWDETARVWTMGDGAEALVLDDLIYKAQHVVFSPSDAILAMSHKGWVRMIHLPTGRQRTMFRAGDGWLAHDSSGHYDCAGEGCARAAYHTAQGEYLFDGDSRLTKLKGLQQFGASK